jgi:RIO kinase 1
MHAALEVLLADGVIDEVTARLKSGKEADVYIVVHGGQYVAAKIYKERTQRNFKNNSGYKEGRLVRNSRTRRAMEKGSRFGQEAEEEAWKTAEAETLGKLHTAGVRVPSPVMFYEGVLLMELVVDAEGQPAPRLVDALLTPELASEFYRDLRQQAVKILCCDLIHGDLSAYNILLGANGPTIIDFPQTVAAAANSRAEFFFKRDLDNLRLFFAGYDPSLLGREGDSAEIWKAYTRRELTPDFEPTGRGAPDRRGPRHGARPGGRPHGEGGRSFPPQERAFAPVHEAREAAAPAVEEDEFALLRQGGGERPKVAQLAKAGRGGDRPRRGGPGGGPRGGGHSGRPSGGERRGPPNGGSSHPGQSRPHGDRPQQGGRAAGQPHGARPPHGGGGSGQPHASHASHGAGGSGQPHGAHASHGAGGSGQPHAARAQHGGGGGSGQPHAARAQHGGGGGSGQPHAARAQHGGGGQGAPHGRRAPHGGGGQGAPRGGNAPHHPGGGAPHAAQGGGRPQQHGHQGARGERPQGSRPPRQGRRGAAPVVSYVSRGATPEPGGSTEEP